MKILMLCGVFADENTDEVVNHAKAPVEFSANRMQQKLISGFRSLPYDFEVLSAPFINSFPNGSSICYFRGFENNHSEYTYVTFNNIWGLRNLSRASALKKKIKTFAEDKEKEKLILVYCPHTPFLEAAVYAKRIDPNIKLCLYVPDLPNYMNLSAKRSWIYDFAKKYDIAKMTKLMQQVDSFVLLTEQMKDMLPIGDKPYIVVEGVIDQIPELQVGDNATSEKYIVYTGKLNEKFGVKDLIDSFQYIDDSAYRLVLCGSGDCEAYAREASLLDDRILVLGQILPEEALKWQKKAAVLVNPRSNNDEYTKYSFPSKNIEYLLTGKPVVAYMLDGMPSEYEEFIFPINQDVIGANSIAEAIKTAISSSEEYNDKYLRFKKYADKLLTSNIARAILEIIK